MIMKDKITRKLIILSAAIVTLSPACLAQSVPVMPGPPSIGNGIYHYSVASDWYLSTQTTSQLPTLSQDLRKYNKSNIQYVFLDFIALQGGAIPTNSQVLDKIKLSSSPPIPNIATCPPSTQTNQHPNPILGNYVISYVALPQVNWILYNGSLGYCVNGATATAYYKNLNLKVVPNAEYDDTFASTIASSNINVVNAVADTLAGLITSDPNTYGIAIDNEKAINSYAPNGPTNEINFFKELALKLAQAKPARYLFLFDAPATAKTLYNLGYTNVVIMAPQYDLGDSTKFNPVKIGTGTPKDTNPDTYSSQVFAQSVSALGASAAPGQSVTLVVPASATSTIWDYENAYNYPLYKPVKPSDPSSYTTPVVGQSILPNSPPSNCLMRPVLDINETNILNSLILNTKTYKDFLGPLNCYNYQNPTPIDNYFQTSLAAVNYATGPSIAKPAARLLGVTLYAWRNIYYENLNGVKSYYSAFTQGAPPTQWVGLNTAFQVGPANIKSSVWQYFNSWVTQNPQLKK